MSNNEPDGEIRHILDFWFSDALHDEPSLDGRMERWFNADPAFDGEIRQRFGGLVAQAAAGALDGWAATPHGRLALILLLDQFPRNIHRGTRQAFARDAQALKVCVEGAMHGDFRQLSPIEQVFFFMPLQHAESLKIQERSVRIYEGLANGVPGTLKATFTTFAQFAELHRDIIAAFGRFPHRNPILGRDSTALEAEYLESGAPGFGQHA